MSRVGSNIQQGIRPLAPCQLDPCHAEMATVMPWSQMSTGYRNLYYPLFCNILLMLWIICEYKL